ncbi:flavodoxin domain-containing protein [Streptomyces macrosporus]|uniref:Flavodoxin domain-containing protein n=1 Tax=Streptomyces macrosporus TaxID=44032 RepID=A0ABP5WU57_9ACTN
MTARHVLVAYGSKNGSTAEIAQWIGAALRERHLEADVLPAAEVDDLAPYDAVLLGSGLYAGRWHRQATRLARRRCHELARRPVWLFSSGPLDTSADEHDIPPTPQVTRIAARLDAYEHVTFGGSLADDARGFIARQLLAHGKGGDFRNRERIRRWAHAIADELTGAPQII